MKKHLKYFSGLLLLCIAAPYALHAQDSDVIKQLKNIEKGNIQESKKALSSLKVKYPGNPSVLFLEAVLTTDGQTALELYKTVYEKNPDCAFADASLYRMFSYYYSIGLYKKAEETLTNLKTKYPKSPYIQAADRTIPEELPSDSRRAIQTENPQTEKTGNDNFTVQAGAFLNIQNAQSLKKSLEADGFYSEITTKEVGGSMLNVVLAGKFGTEKGADSLITHLDKKYRLKGKVVPVIKQAE